jgi:hypothetical protein
VHAPTIRIGDIFISSAIGRITGVTDPQDNQDVATKKYVDDNAGGGLTPAYYYIDRVNWSNISNYNKTLSGGYHWFDLALGPAPEANNKIGSVLTNPNGGDIIVTDPGTYEIDAVIQIIPNTNASFHVQIYGGGPIISKVHIVNSMNQCVHATMHRVITFAGSNTNVNMQIGGASSTTNFVDKFASLTVKRIE